MFAYYRVMLSRSNDLDETPRRACWVRRWCAGDELPPGELQGLRDWVAGVARADYKNRKGLAAVMRTWDLTIDLVAQDYTADLFGCDSERYLKIALGDSLLGDDASLIADFKAIIIRHVRQGLYKRFEEIDPTGFDIRRRMLEVLRHSPRVKLWPFAKPRWAALKDQSDLRTNRPEIPLEEAIHLVVVLSSHHKTSPPLIHAILETLAADTRWQAAIRIEETLYQSLRMAAEQGILSAEALRMIIEPNETVRVAARVAVDVAMSRIKEIVSRYAADGKLDAARIDAFERAVFDLLCDYGETGMWQGDYCAYLRRHCADLTVEEYCRRYKARFEYIALCAEREFLDALEDELGH